MDKSKNLHFQNHATWHDLPSPFTRVREFSPIRKNKCSQLAAIFPPHQLEVPRIRSALARVRKIASANALNSKVHQKQARQVSILCRERSQGWNRRRHWSTLSSWTSHPPRIHVALKI